MIVSNRLGLHAQAHTYRQQTRTHSQSFYVTNGAANDVSL